MKEKIRHKKKAKKFDWVYIHPYVHISVKHNHAILYNTLSGKLLEYRDNKSILTLIKRLSSDSGLYVAKLSEPEIDVEIERFIKQIREHYMGDRLANSHCPHRPFQMKPMLNLQETFDSLISGESSGKLLIDDEIQDYLEEITFYISSRCDQSCSNCKSAYKQYFSCMKNDGGDREMKFDSITALVEEVKSSRLYKIRITGGNIFFYPELPELIRYLDRVPVIKEFLIHYFNIKDHRWFFELLEKELNQLIVTIHFPVNYKILDNCMKILGQYPLNKRILFMIEEEEHLMEAENISSRFNIKKRVYAPHYNRANYDFFKEHVFLDRQAIIEAKPSMQDIFAHKILNSRDFQKLTVLCNGEIYANINHPKIGRLDKDPVFELVSRELHRGKSWTKVRAHITPCKSCVYNCLCPPISNYEYVLGKYNLCNVM